MAVCVGEVPGKRVQELSKPDDELPLRFIRHEPDKPTKEASPLPSTIPVIDLRLLGDESKEKEEEMEKFRGALQSWGFFQIMSNGIFKSAVHRVVTNTEKARLSLALFYAPEPEMVIKPADGLIDQTRPRFYKQTKSRDYSDIFFENYADGKRAIDLAKV
eukprot:TRINITY_DN148_c0_g1_i1.p1 TRINITY_DN148_c0_g1~~TRINITY_DN148_c0_g1_i1.p1  ORF type:complete len:160 (+),score=30.95 TRINITY_DN148_c0_g1_i1:157-636(+)